METWRQLNDSVYNENSQTSQPVKKILRTTQYLPGRSSNGAAWNRSSDQLNFLIQTLFTLLCGRTMVQYALVCFPHTGLVLVINLSYLWSYELSFTRIYKCYSSEGNSFLRESVAALRGKVFLCKCCSSSLVVGSQGISKTNSLQQTSHKSFIGKETRGWHLISY